MVKIFCWTKERKLFEVAKILSDFVFSNKVSLKFDLLIEESAVNTSKERLVKTFNEFFVNVVINLGINDYI